MTDGRKGFRGGVVAQFRARALRPHPQAAHQSAPQGPPSRSPARKCRATRCSRRRQSRRDGMGEAEPWRCRPCGTPGGLGGTRSPGTPVPGYGKEAPAGPGPSLTVSSEDTCGQVEPWRRGGRALPAKASRRMKPAVWGPGRRQAWPWSAAKRPRRQGPGGPRGSLAYTNCQRTQTSSSRASTPHHFRSRPSRNQRDPKAGAPVHPEHAPKGQRPQTKQGY